MKIWKNWNKYSFIVSVSVRNQFEIFKLMLRMTILAPLHAFFAMPKHILFNFFFFVSLKHHLHAQLPVCEVISSPLECNEAFGTINAFVLHSITSGE